MEQTVLNWKGGIEKVPIVSALTEQGIDTCAHIGHNPQIHGTKASTHGRTFAKAKQLIEAAEALADAGAKLIVLEKVTEEVSQIITDRLRIPTIGIGAGRFCDGQVLVINDILGIGPPLKHAKRYQDYSHLTFEAICRYKEEVANGTFPTDANTSHIPPDKLTRVQKWLRSLQLNRFRHPEALRQHRRKLVRCYGSSEFCRPCL